MSEKDQLILELRRISENGHALSEEENISRYTEMMLQHIGDTDPELRDDLICDTFYKWLRVKAYYSDDDLIRIMNILIDEDHLFYHIGNDGDESVFTRSFSVLVVALILERHRKKPFLDFGTFSRVERSLIDYYQREKDLNGYFDEYGWAHAAAHGSDAFEELVQCTEINDATVQDILASIKTVLYNEKYILCNEEDERIARLIYRIISIRQLPCQSIHVWIEGLSDCSSWERTRKQYIARVNAKNLIRCLYLKLIHKKEEMDLIDTLLDTERKLNKFI